MTNDKFKPVQNIPKTETRIVLNDWEKQPVKKSNLSVAARSKIINRSGGNYLSENQEGYKPCFDHDCSYTKSRLREQIQRLERKIPYAPDKATFYLRIYFSQNRLFNWHFHNIRFQNVEDSGYMHDEIVIQDIGGAREIQTRLSANWVKVVGTTGSTSENSEQKKREIMRYIDGCIQRYGDGQGETINESRDFN